MLRVFEMFSGVGGASFALRKAGVPFECVGFSEINLPAIKIFKQNHGSHIKNFGDCTKINPSELPDFDLLTAGFPCQPFSVNTRHNVRGKEHKDFNLFNDIIRILKIKMPRYIILENVKGLMGDKGKDVLKQLLYELNGLGYHIKQEILNSKDYGSPQNRERVFFIGKLGEWNEGQFKWPRKEELKITVKDLLEEGAERREPAIKTYELKKQCNIDKYGKITRFEAIMKNPVNKRNSNVAFEILDAPSNVVSRQSDRIYKPTYSPCLTATGRDYCFYVNGEVITLTPRECFRLMGFTKDEITLDGISDTQKYSLAGNGWDINLVSKIMRNIKW